MPPARAAVTISGNLILHAVTVSVTELVTATSLAEAMPRALHALAAALQVDRIVILERSAPSADVTIPALLHAWQAAWIWIISRTSTTPWAIR